MKKFNMNFLDEEFFYSPEFIMMKMLWKITDVNEHQSFLWLFKLFSQKQTIDAIIMNKKYFKNI